MKRSAWIQRKKRLNAISNGRVAYNLALEELKPLVEARAGYICERCGAAPIDHIHHKLRRGQGGTNMMSNLLALCSRCHRLVHDNPEQSYLEGTLLRRHSDPI